MSFLKAIKISKNKARYAMSLTTRFSVLLMSNLAEGLMCKLLKHNIELLFRTVGRTVCRLDD